MFGGVQELLLLMANPKLPGDTRFILVDPHYCLDEEFADFIADNVRRQSNLETSHAWDSYKGTKYNSVAAAAQARFLEMPQFEAEDVHVHMKGRGKNYKKPEDIPPTSLASKLVHVLKAAHKMGKGDIVFLSNDYDYDEVNKKLTTRNAMHMTAFTVAAARKLLAVFETEIKPVLQDATVSDTKNIGKVLKGFLLSTLNWDSDISFGYLVPTLGHRINFKQLLVHPIRYDFDWTREEYWACGWVGNLDMWNNADQMPRVEIFEMTRDESLKMRCHVYPQYPLEPYACWITYIDQIYLEGEDTSPCEYLRIDGEMRSVYNLPHPQEDFTEEAHGFTDYSDSGQKPPKRFKRGFRSGRTRYQNRIWTSKKNNEAASPQCIHRFDMWLLMFSQIVLFLVFTVG